MNSFLLTLKITPTKNNIMSNNINFSTLFTFVRDFILSETQEILHHFEMIDWSLEELWTKEFLDDCETVNEFGFRGLVELILCQTRNLNVYSASVVENANFFILNMLNVYFINKDDEEELNRMVRSWHDNYEFIFKSIVLDIYNQIQAKYFFEKEQVSELVDSFTKGMNML